MTTKKQLEKKKKKKERKIDFTHHRHQVKTTGERFYNHYSHAHERRLALSPSPAKKEQKATTDGSRLECRLASRVAPAADA